MKKNYLLFLVTLFTCSAYAQRATFSVKKVSSTKWNTSDGIYYTQVPGANLGVTSFELISNRQIAFLSNSKNEIVIVNSNTGKAEKRFSVSIAPRDFCYDNKMFYVLSEYKVSIYSMDGKLNNSIDFDRKFIGVERLKRQNNSTYLILPTGNSLLIETNGQKIEPKETFGRVVSYGNNIAIRLNGNNSYSITGNSLLGNYFEKTFTTTNKVAGVFVVDANANQVILDVQTYLSESPIKVERKIVSIKTNKAGFGNIIAEIKIPDMYYVISNKDFSLSKKGNLYNMITTPDGVFVYLLTESKNGNPYPKSLLTQAYHFNDHLINIEEN